MVGTSEAGIDHPVFIPPRKRLTTRKFNGNGNQNYIDHIVVTTQGKHKLSPTILQPSPNISLDLDGNTSVLNKLSLNQHQQYVNKKICNSTSLSNVGQAREHENALHLSTSNEKNLHSSNINLTSNSLNFFDGKRLNKSQDCLIVAADDGESKSISNRTVNDGTSIVESTKGIRSIKKRVNICTDNVRDSVSSTSGTSTTTVTITTTDSGPGSRSQQRNIVQKDEIIIINSPQISINTNFDDLESVVGETKCILNDSTGDTINDSTGDTIHDRIPYRNNGQQCNNSNTIRSTETYLTMTGTIKRGRKKGESLDLQLNISREELEQINAATLIAVEQQTKNKHNLCCMCTITTGIHILLLSILCLPFVIIITCIYSFYIGTLTWYNMFNYFNEEKTYFHKLVMSPILIFSYPILIVFCTIGLGLYAGLIQLSLQFTSWMNEIGDIEKGFYGWLCSFLHLSDCSPYEVVILTDLCVPDDAYPTTATHSSTEELSL